MKYKIRLERVKRTNFDYQRFRDRHYIPNHGAVGQQLHYLIYIYIYIYPDWKLVGIISAGSAVYASHGRDEFFGLTKQNREIGLNSIVNNTVFRLEYNVPNLGTQILSEWRWRVIRDWKAKYGVEVHGFETFVVENERRKGSMYKADNWTYCGETSGSTKTHRGLSNKGVWKKVDKKLIFCKKVKGTKLCTEYISSWNLRKDEIPGQMSIFDLVGEGKV